MNEPRLPAPDWDILRRCGELTAFNGSVGAGGGGGGGAGDSKVFPNYSEGGAGGDSKVYFYDDVDIVDVEFVSEKRKMIMGLVYDFCIFLAKVVFLTLVFLCLLRLLRNF